MALTAKQEKFAQAVAGGVSPVEAYREVYGAKNRSAKTLGEDACRASKHPKIYARIEELRAKATEKVVAKLALTKEWVLSELVKVNAAAQAAEPVLDREGNSTGEYKANLAAANRALELIGKELGMFVDRKEIRTSPLDDLSHDDLVALDELIARDEVQH